ncbi:MAG: phosphate signaling complex protein PhoU [Verrucomicrobia bacterium]|nr:phosphate signaling complex protein PhoU [Verrucomicrobiota bacterium]MBU4289564.1 phosphate signaling complex protein PhoU [Verrucomicrobiota bacterium]MBU4428972.1 phosphate signaling complex protein PhoU [Verrucomicrobiota bacterium]MBU4496829.1 phosphate signaling complex protein PhoU [Verrucomicrobiota bacterium]
MERHLQREIDKLKRRLLALSAEVENDVRMAVRAVEDREPALAETVLRRETQINATEVEVEEECLKILALYQPVAADLRYIIAVLKINQDLERIGDLAEHIAERGLFLCQQPRLDIPFRLGLMADKAQAMLKKVLDAFVNLDEAAARAVCAADEEIDAIHRDNFQQVKTAVTGNSQLFEPLLQFLHISRHLERIADHATNIAEDLIYLIEGRIVRHTPEVKPDETRSGQMPGKPAGPPLPSDL